MMNSIDFLDAVRARHQIPSDNKLAAFLEFPQGRISQVRTGSRKIDDGLALKIADALDLPEGYVVSEIQAERATDPNLRRVWRSVATSILDMAKKGQAAGLALLAIGAFCTAPSAEAAALQASSDEGAQRMYIMVNRIRKWLQRFRCRRSTSAPTRVPPYTVTQLTICPQ